MQCNRFIPGDNDERKRCQSEARVVLIMRDRGGDYEDFLCDKCAETVRLIVEADPEVSIHLDEALNAKADYVPQDAAEAYCEQRDYAEFGNFR